MLKSAREIYLEEELKRVRAERDWYKRECEADGLVVAMPETGPELTLPVSSPDLVPIAEIRAGKPMSGGYAVHAYAFGASHDPLTDYRAMYRMDEIAYNRVCVHDAINYILPRMHDVFIHQLASKIRQTAKVAT